MGHGILRKRKTLPPAEVQGLLPMHSFGCIRSPPRHNPAGALRIRPRHIASTCSLVAGHWLSPKRRGKKSPGGSAGLPPALRSQSEELK